MADADILVVGAGPVGMLAALLSAQQGLSVLLLERSAVRQAQSRAIGITPPSLEILRRVGLPDAFIERGVPVRVSEIHGRRMRLGTLDFTGLESEFRFVLSIPQHRTESLLEEAILAHPSIRFLRGHHVTDCSEEEGKIAVGGNLVESGRFRFTGKYVLACDGGKSTIREAMGIPFDGAPNQYSFLMGDFEDTTGWGTQARFYLFRARFRRIVSPSRRQAAVCSANPLLRQGMRRRVSPNGASAARRHRRRRGSPILGKRFQRPPLHGEDVLQEPGLPLRGFGAPDVPRRRSEHEYGVRGRRTGRVAFQTPDRETGSASPGFQAVRQGAEERGAGGGAARPMVDARGRIRRTPGIGTPEFCDLPFPPHPGSAVPGSIVQHAIHAVPQSGELPGSLRKGVESCETADVPRDRTAEKGLLMPGFFPEMRLRNIDRQGNDGPGGRGSGPIATDHPAIPMDKLSVQREPDVAARTFFLQDGAGTGPEVHAPGRRGRWLRYRDMGRPRGAEPGSDAGHYGAGQ